MPRRGRAASRQFCREQGIIGLTDEPLSIIWTPVFMRAYGRAFLDSPGPLDKGLQSHFFITPPDDDATPESIESYMREDNDRMLRLLCIHEGVPGHYLQLAWSNRSPSLIRTIFSDGMFAEGWACYVEQVLMDLGYGADDPALLLTHWKFELRAITNAILDVETHTRGMTEEAAIDLMVRQAFQEEDEARAKWLRARLTSTQLSTYYVGTPRCSTWRSRRASGRPWRLVARPRDVPPQRVWAASATRPASTTGPTSSRSSRHGTPPIRWVAPHPRRGRVLAELAVASRRRSCRTVQPSPVPCAAPCAWTATANRVPVQRALCSTSQSAANAFSPAGGGSRSIASES